MTHFLLALRASNAGLGVLVTAGLCYRLPQALQNVASKRLFLILAAFPLLVALGSAQAVVLRAPVGPVTALFTLAYVALGWVCIRWPSQLDGPAVR